MTTQIITTEFKWELENFKKNIIDANKSASSEFFYLNDGSTATFHVRISRCCCIHLVCDDFGQEKEIKLNAKFWIENADKKFGQSVQPCFFNRVGNVMESEDFVPDSIYSSLKAQIKDGSTTVFFEITQEIPVSEVKNEEVEVDSRGNIEEAILSLHDDSTFVTIKAEDKEIKIFKHFLVRYSEAFKKMLTIPNSTGANSDTIDMKEFKASVVEAMRTWMYMGKIEKFDEVAPALFQVAHKYMIVNLKEKCVYFMCRGLTWENLPSRLILAHKYSEELLKQRTLEFIRKDRENLNLLMMSNDWIKLNGNDPEMVKKIVASI